MKMNTMERIWAAAQAAADHEANLLTLEDSEDLAFVGWWEAQQAAQAMADQWGRLEVIREVE